MNLGEAEAITPKQLAEGWHLSERFIYEQLRLGRIPHVRLGRRILISRRALADFINAPK